MRKLLAPFLLVAVLAAPAVAQKVYGPGLRADSLSNISLNSRNITVSWTFTAARSEPLLGIRLTSPIRPGYTMGNGGNIYVKVGPYSGFIFHNATDPYAIATFAPGPSLVAGQTYTVTVRNVADDPITNWRSVDGLVVNTVDPLDLPNSTVLSGVAHPTNWPMWEIIYASTGDVSKSPVAQGIGYVDVPLGAAVPVANGVREVITPIQPLTVTGGAISLRGMTQPGTVTIWANSGSAVGSAVLYPPAIANGWAPFHFSGPVILPAGGKYFLQPTTTQAGVTAVTLQKGWHRANDGVSKLFDFAPQTWFAEGNAQEMVNGVWVDWLSEQGANDPRMDLQFYLVRQ